MSVKRLAVVILVAMLLAMPRVVRSEGRTESAGDVLQFALPAVSLGEAWYKKDGKGALELLESYALSTGVTYALKETVHEHRPNGGMHSFPSGHASSAFTAAEFLRVRYGLKWGVPAYVAAAFVAYSRVEAHKHWTHDVVAGAAIGVLSSHIFTRKWHGMDVSLSAGHRSFEILLYRRF